jgi:hypothetical protein
MTWAINLHSIEAERGSQVAAADSSPYTWQWVRQQFELSPDCSQWHPVLVCDRTWSITHSALIDWRFFPVGNDAWVVQLRALI